MICDRFIQRCKEDLISQDLEEAIRIRDEATSIFDGIIPGWSGGLMSSYTGFYLDDVEMILGKLSIFKSNQISGSIKKPYHGLTQVVKYVMSTHEAFEKAIEHIEKEQFLQSAEMADVIDKIRQYQLVAESNFNFDEKWIQISPFVAWISTLDSHIARHLLPLVVHKIK